MKILDLVLKGCWYDMIAKGEKREEYREIKPYWENRLTIKDFTHVRFRRGYTNTTMLFRIDSITIGKGNPQWGAPEDKEVFIIKFSRHEREIKFRGYNAKNGKWIYGCYLVNRGQTFICPDGIQPPDATWEDFLVDSHTVGQYIGLKDQNGKEIYEGDFIKKDYPFEGVYLVKYDEVILMWKFFVSGKYWLLPNDFPAFDYEIIGNIHDNPELLEEQK